MVWMNFHFVNGAEGPNFRHSILDREREYALRMFVVSVVLWTENGSQTRPLLSVKAIVLEISPNLRIKCITPWRWRGRRRRLWIIDW